jgi:hypothetical protein
MKAAGRSFAARREGKAKAGAGHPMAGNAPVSCAEGAVF